MYHTNEYEHALRSQLCACVCHRFLFSLRVRPRPLGISARPLKSRKMRRDDRSFSRLRPFFRGRQIRHCCRRRCLWSQKKTASKMTIARIPFRFPFLPPRLPHDSSEWRSCLPYNLDDAAWNLRLRKGLINQYSVNVACLREMSAEHFSSSPFLSA